MQVEYYQLYVTDLQRQIMKLCVNRARTQRNPITRKYILAHLGKSPVHKSTICAAIRVLIKRNFIRRSVVPSDGASYVVLRFL